MSGEAGAQSNKPLKKRGKVSQERLMIMFTLFFITGVLILVLLPEGNPARAIAMSLYSVAVFWAMFRFAV